MDKSSVHKPFLSSRGSGHAFVRKTPGFVNLAKWILKIAMWVLFTSWVALMFVFPAEFGSKLFQKWVAATSGTVFRVSGSLFLLFSGPILIIAFLAVVFLIISGEEQLHEKKTSKYPSFRLRTYPVLVDGPFGVVSAAEVIGILLFIVYVLWAVGSYTARLLGSLSGDLTFKMKRGSVLLRLINIPFEHATKYHVWLGHLTMLLFTVHGLLYLVAWTIEGRLLQQVSAHAILEKKDQSEIEYYPSQEEIEFYEKMERDDAKRKAKEKKGKGKGKRKLVDFSETESEDEVVLGATRPTPSQPKKVAKVAKKSKDAGPSTTPAATSSKQTLPAATVQAKSQPAKEKLKQMVLATKKSKGRR
ncbi:hypothetical protein ACLB2K_045367 [Fragaria x ananassa]